MIAGLRRALSRSGLLLLLLLGHAAAGLFVLRLSDGLGAIEDPSIRAVALLVKRIFLAVGLPQQPALRVLVGGAAAFLLLRCLQGRPPRRALDPLGILLCLRCALQFVLLNLLLLSPLRAGSLLLVQLVIFLPVVTIAFGWLYLRLDGGARSRGRTHIRFGEESGSLDGFDYFHAAAMTLLQFEPAGASATTRLMKSLFVLHGIVMLDLVALTLSRAIGLASGSS